MVAVRKGTQRENRKTVYKIDHRWGRFHSLCFAASVQRCAMMNNTIPVSKSGILSPAMDCSSVTSFCIYKERIENRTEIKTRYA